MQVIRCTDDLDLLRFDQQLFAGLADGGFLISLARLHAATRQADISRLTRIFPGTYFQHNIIIVCCLDQSDQDISFKCFILAKQTRCAVFDFFQIQ